MLSAAEEGTKKMYLDDFTLLTCKAEVVKISETDEGCTLELDQTCFYPGGGGQPCDVGRITWENGVLNIKKVQKNLDGIVEHYGELEGCAPRIGSDVECYVDADARRYHSRLHSAGHLLDLSVERAGYTWKPGRGAHHPDMAFVEYEGEFDSQSAETYRHAIQKQIDAITKTGGKVSVARVKPEEARRRSSYIPESILKKYDLIHLATYNGTFDICCGGTHVSEISDIDAVEVTKVKKKNGVIRVSYKVAP